MSPYILEVFVLSRLSLSGGGDERDRTDGLLLAKQALSQLSYTPEGFHKLIASGLKWTRTTDLTLIRRAL